MPELVHQRAYRPRQYRTACAALLLAASLTTSGCFLGRGKKPAKVFTPPPVYAKTPPPAKPKPVELTAPPDIATDVVEPAVEPVVAVAPNLPPAPPKPTPPKPAVTKPAPTVVEIVPAPVVPAPKPATIFSAAERQRMNQEIDQSLGKVRAALARVEGRNLSAELTALANNARSMMQNAEQARAQDLVTAVSLAKRAESFATELVQRLL